MATIATYFEQAQLSLAAYALNLQRGAFGSQNLEYVARLVDAGMSQKQAEVFAATYSVVDQFSDSLTGFSATVFDKAGVKYFAIRGTQLSDPRDLISDAMLAVNGVAATQSVALYNYYQRLVTPRGQPVAQLEFAGTAVGYRLSNSSGATGILRKMGSGSHFGGSCVAGDIGNVNLTLFFQIPLSHCMIWLTPWVGRYDTSR